MSDQNKVFICQRCEHRILKKHPKRKIGFNWTLESFIKLKKKFIKENGHKTTDRLVLTTCLGSCPENGIAYQKTQGGKLKPFESYKDSENEDSVYNLLFK